MTTMRPLLSRRSCDEPGADLDRVLLESGLDEPPPARSMDKTLAALGIGSAVAIGAATTTAVSGGAAGAGAASGVAAKAAATSWLSLSVAKVAGGIAIATVALGGSYVATRGSRSTLRESAAQVAPVPTDAANAAPSADLARLGELQLGRSGVSIDREVEKQRELEVGPRAWHPNEPRASGDDAKPVSPADGEPASTTDTKVGVRPKAALGSRDPRETPSQIDPRAGERDASPNALSPELTLAVQARAALSAGNYDACLARVAAYQHRYPKGQLASDVATTGAACTAKKSASK